MGSAISPTHAAGTNSALAVGATATVMIRLKEEDTVQPTADLAVVSVGIVTIAQTLRFVWRIAGLVRQINFSRRAQVVPMPKCFS